MSSRDFRRHAGQIAIAGFSGHSIPAGLKALAREFDLGGVIFFARNIESPEQVAELSREAQELARELPLWVSVDQEGGRVARLKSPFTLWPPMQTLGRSGNDELAARFARALAAELKAVGISMDYTPVLDVATNPKNPVIGDRSLAERAEDVARLGSVIIRTLQDEGIAASGKHFPGHGDTSVDSHFELPLVEHPPDRLEAVELVPFRAAIEAGVASIMTAHILIPALDEERPATLSSTIVDGLLKQQLGYDGLVLSDDRELAELNERHLGVEGASDVLSFPLLSPEAYPPHPGRPGNPKPAAYLGGTPALDDEGPGRPRPPFALPAGVRTHLGDIIVSVERAIEQAGQGRGGQTGDVRWPAAEELRLLVVHGALHLCGWDHDDPVERDAMRTLEREILATSSSSG